MYHPYDPINPKTLVPQSADEPKGSNWKPWLLGCGCGCLMIFIFILFVAVVIYHRQITQN